MDSPLLTAVFALSAAAAWGSGDFSGGMVTRRIGSLHTVFLTYSVGLFVLAGAAIATGEALPAATDLIWGALAGLSGMIGLMFLFRGFATGRMGIVAPVSAVLATAVPVIFTALTQNLPGAVQLMGFALAVVSIWLLSRPGPLEGSPAGLGMALLAGISFGAFFTLLDQISPEAVFWPLAAARLAACAVMAAVILVTRKPVVPANSPVGLILLAGLLDASGNLFFLLAVQTGRLDIASVLGSLYPAVTAILAWLLAGERLARLQAVGIAAAVGAIVLITL